VFERRVEYAAAYHDCVLRPIGALTSNTVGWDSRVLSEGTERRQEAIDEVDITRLQAQWKNMALLTAAAKSHRQRRLLETMLSNCTV